MNVNNVNQKKKNIKIQNIIKELGLILPAF